MQKWLDPDLGVSIGKEFHTYDDDCTISLANIWNELDHYYQVHLANWFLVTFCVRDLWYLHFWSVLDEFIELSTQHILPHFRECWWDHVFMDMLGSNTPAIFFGMFCG